jgi:hypothetical protein
MRVAYADPPYPGCAHLYEDHPDYAGEVDHEELLDRLDNEYDGWLLHTASTTLIEVLDAARAADVYDFRIMAWVKPFAAFKRNVSVAYAWEPMLVKPCRKPVVTEAMVMRDWVSEPITLERGLTGAKPDAVCRWAFHVLGMEPDDQLIDLYPGSGAVTVAWQRWRNDLTLELT